MSTRWKLNFHREFLEQIDGQTYLVMDRVTLSRFAETFAAMLQDTEEMSGTANQETVSYLMVDQDAQLRRLVQEESCGSGS